jgi:hypothetical protein
MTIWGKYKPTGKIERVDQGGKDEIGYLLAEYSLAYGKDWILWAGRKKDQPEENK